MLRHPTIRIAVDLRGILVLDPGSYQSHSEDQIEACFDNDKRRIAEMNAARAIYFRAPENCYRIRFVDRPRAEGVTLFGCVYSLSCPTATIEVSTEHTLKDFQSRRVRTPYRLKKPGEYQIDARGYARRVTAATTCSFPAEIDPAANAEQCELSKKINIEFCLDLAVTRGEGSRKRFRNIGPAFDLSDATWWRMVRQLAR